MVKKNTCVFISGQGSNLKNLIIRSRDNNFPINIKLIITNKKNAYGIIFAKKNSIPYLVVNTKLRNYENKILQILKKNKISLICLAGYMKIISKEFIKKFGKKIINIHPSLLPKFKGLDTFARVLKNNEKKTGCTVHYVNEKLDSGHIIVKKSFYINSNDTEKTLKQRTQKLEYRVFPEAIITIFRNN
jgi:formyltetrahydrofolate-dependent phosphoribosylglycinamide formyltransferase